MQVATRRMTGVCYIALGTVIEWLLSPDSAVATLRWRKSALRHLGGHAELQPFTMLQLQTAALPLRAQLLSHP